MEGRGAADLSACSCGFPFFGLNSTAEEWGTQDRWRVRRKAGHCEIYKTRLVALAGRQADQHHPIGDADG
jgi:hypothetical protein